jgi:hypothetical protein
MSTPEPTAEAWILHASATNAAEAMHLLGIRGTGTPGSCAQNHPVVFAALIHAQAIDRLAETLLEVMEDTLTPLDRIAGAMEVNRARGEEPLIKDREAEARQFAEEQLEELTRGTATDEPPTVMIENASDPLPVQILPNGILVRGTPTPDQLVEILRLAPPATTTLDEPEAAMEIREAAAFGLCAPQEPQEPASPTPGGHPLDQEGWIRSRVPEMGDADGGGNVIVMGRDNGDWFWIHWSAVVLGQPWASGGSSPSACELQPLPAHIAYPESDGWVHDRVPGPEDGDEDGDVAIPSTGVYTQRPVLLRNSGAFIHWSHVVPGQPWLPLRTPA